MAANMTVYVDFEYYENTYGGTAVSSALFHGHAVRASRMIDRLTFGRAAEAIDDEAYTEPIKLATCAVIDSIQEINTRAGQITSEKVGPHSVVYTTTPNSLLSDEARMRQAAKRYLGSTGLMYRGFRMSGKVYND